MRMVTAAIAVLLGCQSAPPPPAMDALARTAEVGTVAYVFRSSPVGDLGYELDCLADLAPCSRPAYEGWWKQHGWTTDDDAAIATWKKLRGAYTGKIEDGTQPADPPPLPLPHRVRQVDVAMRLAAFGARDVPEYLARLALFVDPADLARARDVIERFAPRVEARWREQRGNLSAAADGYATLAARPEVAQLLTSIAAFYRTPLAAGSQQIFELVARPAHESGSYAQQLGPLATVEVSPGEPPSHRYPVVCHEVFHAWFSASPIDQQFALAVAFAKTNDPLAGPAYGLLDEVLATAFGNELVQRAVDPKEYERRRGMTLGFYQDRYIDTVARTLLPDLERALAAGKTVYDPELVPAFLRAVHTAFPDGLGPAAYLRPLAGFTEEALADASDHLARASGANTVSYSSDVAEAREILATSAAWGTFVMLTPDHLAKLDGSEGLVDAAALASLRAQPAPVGLVAPRTPTGTRVVFVAADNAAMIKLVDTLLAEPVLKAGVFAPH